MDFTNGFANQVKVVNRAAAGRKDVVGHDMGITGGFIFEDQGLPTLL